MTELRPTWIVWRGAGSPEPFESDGTPIKKRPITRECSHCGDPCAEYRLDDAISTSFTTVKNNSRMWPFGTDRVCAACVFACKAGVLRATLWFARENGLWFVPTIPLKGYGDTRPDVLDTLLNPPEPPFVAGYGLFGIDHGGEANAHRFHWPDGFDRTRKTLVDAEGDEKPYLLKNMQSKHVAIAAQTSLSRTRYKLQVDDDNECVVDVAAWSRLRAVCAAILLRLRAEGVGATECRDALVSLNAPLRADLRTIAEWPRLVEPLRAVHGYPWWRVFVGLLIVPPFTTPKETKHERRDISSKPRDPRPVRGGADTGSGQRTVSAPPDLLPAPSNTDAHHEGQDRPAPAQQSLF